MTATSRKRKRTKAAKSPWPLSTATSTVATSQKADATLPSLLLDLPPELRNLVYEFVFASTGGVHLSPKAHRKHLACGSALNRVNKQVRHEFLTVGELVVDIHTSAPNFDFRHIVAFLNRLSDKEMQALPSLTVPVQRKVIVDLQPSSTMRPMYLERWINRIEHPTKKGMGGMGGSNGGGSVKARVVEHPGRIEAVWQRSLSGLGIERSLDINKVFC
ncbi:hypothetical protein LTR56_004230 [Elasticomyces elasticus]|nr:hypothetical protein LTR56_004230 [Elasticomyces elasticus]KAK4907704.1 hypothetical protein LTR49_023300 [Elasticomyces elasticus]KAK5750568.1 hypothetical protein LTS12_019358 [Elasticomyces elasticus]